MVISQLSQSLQPLLRVVGGQAGELRKFQVAKGPRKLGVGCAQEGSGEEVPMETRENGLEESAWASEPDN